jgi:NAD(P)-dependent dehydrogenase (short-subunit alcohol dehydrogenase family)
MNAVITGGGGDIGGACARLLASSGAMCWSSMPTRNLLSG